ncbi:hypothetical protein [Streptomyces sp. NPDC047869]|uniref:hypothetical protein n=1 Tax=Streptomyces sp. NPDC047869 TaxID=3154709 RepID=UPI00345343AD
MIAHLLLDQLHAVVTSCAFQDAKEPMEMLAAVTGVGTFAVKLLLPGKGRRRSR